MTAGWVAPVTRGRALLDRTVGAAGARAIAAAPTWDEARAALATTAYGRELPADADRVVARRSASSATVWQFRVLAGWLPPGATSLARLAVAPIEIGNIEGHVARLHGADDRRPVTLGPLAVVWPRISMASSDTDVRATLARSTWGDPGGSDEVSIALGLRIAWARRALRAGSIARPWAMGGLALLAARERLVFEREVNAVAARELDRLLPSSWRSATSVADLAGRLPDSASWVLADVVAPADLWRAELALLRRVVVDATPVAASGRYGPDTVLAIGALLLVDLWRVTAAIEAMGSPSGGAEVFDAVAT